MTFPTLWRDQQRRDTIRALLQELKTTNTKPNTHTIQHLFLEHRAWAEETRKTGIEATITPLKKETVKALHQLTQNKERTNRTGSALMGEI